MKERILLCIVICVLLSIAPFALFSKPVSKAELLSLGQAAFHQKAVSVSPSSVDSPLKDFFFVEDQDALYLAVLNFDSGFIVMAAEDAVMPVLAYSFESNLSLPDMAPGAQMWLQQYENEIRAVRRAGEEADVKAREAWSALRNGAQKAVTEVVVNPLLPSKWNQTKFYNRYSPLDEEASVQYDYRTPNGCVAVAMAQICYYYRYPLQGIGSHTNHSSYGTFTVNYAQQHYNYDVMMDQLNWYNDEVAKLIFHCATAVNMMYAADGSGAYSGDVPDALIDHFGYADNAQYVSKYSYNNSQWRNMLQEELDARRPIYYSGFSDEGGHAFVCDGYNDDDLFHFNFGWGGSSDGFYTLSSSESSNAVGGFHGGQSAVIHIYPADAAYPYHCVPRLIKAKNGTLEDGSGAEPYANNASCTYIITEDSAYKVSVSILSFQTEEANDVLEFWDGNPANGNLLLSLSGNDAAGHYYDFTTDSLYITFTTNESVTDEGWRLEYYVYQNGTTCGTSQLHEYAGTISDGSGAAAYQPNSNCVWVIRLMEASEITFTFESLDLSPEDEIVFYDIRTVPRTRIASYSGSTLPAPFTLNTSKVMITFNSDNYLNRDGFVLSWTSDGPVEDAVETYDDNAALTIYPNPASQWSYVKMNDACAGGTLAVYDLAGRQMFVNQIVAMDGGQAKIDVGNLANGIYFVVCKTEGQIYKQKLVVRH